MTIDEIRERESNLDVKNPNVVLTEMASAAEMLASYRRKKEARRATLEELRGSCGQFMMPTSDLTVILENLDEFVEIPERCQTLGHGV